MKHDWQISIITKSKGRFQKAGRLNQQLPR
jgi:hypothetical protein